MSHRLSESVVKVAAAPITQDTTSETPGSVNVEVSVNVANISVNVNVNVYFGDKFDLNVKVNVKEIPLELDQTVYYDDADRSSITGTSHG